MSVRGRPLRVLLLAPFPPRLDASYGGGRAVAHLTRGLAAEHEVALLCLRGPHEPATDPSLIRACVHVEEIASCGSTGAAHAPWRRRLRLALGWLSGRPMWATDAYAPALGRRARALAREWHPDIVQIEFHVMSQYSRWLRGCSAPRVLTEHDPSGVLALPADRRRSIQQRALERVDRQAWRRFTQRAVRAVDATVVFSDSDARTLHTLVPDARIERIPLAVSRIGRPLDSRGEDPTSLLFFGSYRHPPNADAARRLVNTIFPRVAAQFPSARLYIVGEEPGPELSTRHSGSIVVTGRVPDVVPYLERAAVVVAPLRSGGGTRVKILEALSAGKAIVASSVAVAGLELRDREHVIIADDDDAMVRSIVNILRNPDERVRLGEAAFAWAAANVNPERSVQTYIDLYRSLLENRRQVAGRIC